MVKFLTTTEISAALNNLIKNAQNEIILISPYVKVNQKLQDVIKDADHRGVQFWLLYGKSDMKPEEWDWIRRLTNKEVGFVQNLHAKCYLNENTAIITSMNLYEFSQWNNDEMGILVSRAEEAELFEVILAECQRLARVADPQKILDQPTKTPPVPKQPSVGTRTAERPPAAKPAPAAKKMGRCIRCVSVIDFDTDKPLCYDPCYQKWAQYGDRDYAEKYCHHCGKENATSMAKPLCDPCSMQVGK